MNELREKTIKTEDLEIAYFEYGNVGGWPVILSHGFPYDAHAFDKVAPILVQNGARVIAPYTRGFGSTRFIDNNALRNAQQVARGRDIVHLSQALDLKRPIIGGFDWGGNASCVAAALWPEQISGLVSYASYDIIDTAEQRHALPP
jgi:pimeloyl-ACP methyl ester carboxylesterase